MSSKPHTDAVYVPKRKPKNPITFKFSLNEEQKQAKATILSNVITVITGGAGSGKTLLAVQTGLDLLFSKAVEKIIIARPVVTATNEEIGFLPGDMKEKMDPYMAPIYDNMGRIYGEDKIKKCIEDKEIEIIPFAFMRGRNMSNAFIILDEAQNTTDKQMELVITRLCLGSRMVIVGDVAQIDLKDRRMSGLYFLNKAIVEAVPGVAKVHLKTNHRHEIVEPIIEIYKSLYD